MATSNKRKLTVREAILELQTILRDVGDLEVCSMTEVDGRFCIERGRNFDVIEVPEDEVGAEQFSGPICVFWDVEGCQHDEPSRASYLKILKTE